MTVTVSHTVPDWKISININMDIDGDLQAISLYFRVKWRIEQVKERKDRFTVTAGFFS